MWVTKNEDTEAFFHRFNKIEIKGNPWEICAADFNSTPGLIEVQLKETFRNTIADEKKAEEEALKPIDPKPDEEEQTLPHIIGDAIVYPYDTKTYTIVNLNGGTWKLSNNKAKITAQTDSEVTIVITTSKSGSIDLIYNKDENDIISLDMLDSEINNYNLKIKELGLFIQDVSYVQRKGITINESLTGKLYSEEIFELFISNEVQLQKLNENNRYFDCDLKRDFKIPDRHLLYVNW